MEEKLRRKKIEVSEELFVEYRLFSLSDIDELMKIEKSSFRNDSYPKSQLKELFEKYPEEFFVATICGKIVGYAVGYILDGIAEIDSITVDSCYRNLGIGKNLFMVIFKKFRKKGIDRFSLEVSTTNEAAIQFYKKLGFTIVGSLKDYYDDKRDAYLMKMHIF